MVRHNRPKLTGPLNLSGRDEQANTEVVAILAELPADHPARVAFKREKDTITLTHLLADRRDLVGRLMETYWTRDDRIWNNSRGTAPDCVRPFRFP